MDDDAVNRCARCDMRAPAGKKHCDACRRARRADADGEPTRAAQQPWGPRQYLALALLCGLVVILGGSAVVDALRPEPARNTYVERPMELPTAAPAPPSSSKAAPDPAVAIRATYEAQYATAKSVDRENAVRACLLASECPQAQLDGIIAAGAHGREREVLRRLSHAWGAHAAAMRGTDGEQPSHVAIEAAALHLEQCGIADLKKLDWTTHGEADKDIDVARGKMVNLYGPVQQIRRDGDRHWGTMTTSAGWIYFVVVGGTKGVVAGRYAEIAGMIVQRYLYSNAVGGRTDSILIVGRVRGQADSDRPLPPLPSGGAKAPTPATPRRAQAGGSPYSAPPSSTWDLPFPPPSSTATPAPAASAAQGQGRLPTVLDEAPPPAAAKKADQPPEQPAAPESVAAPAGT